MHALNQRTPLLLALAAVIAMLGLTAWQSYQLWQAEAERALPQVRATTAQSQIDINAVPGIALAKLPLFGETSGNETGVEMTTEDLPETNLRLTLRGVLAAEGRFPGSALIEDAKGKTEAYLVGDELPGEAELKTVFPNRIVIARAGRLENLYFPELQEYSGVALVNSSQTTQERAEDQAGNRQATSTANPASEQ